MVLGKTGRRRIRADTDPVPKELTFGQGEKKRTNIHRDKYITCQEVIQL